MFGDWSSRVVKESSAPCRQWSTAYCLVGSSAGWWTVKAAVLRNGSHAEESSQVENFRDMGKSLPSCLPSKECFLEKAVLCFVSPWCVILKFPSVPGSQFVISAFIWVSCAVRIIHQDLHLYSGLGIDFKSVILCFIFYRFLSNFYFCVLSPWIP